MKSVIFSLTAAAAMLVSSATAASPTVTAVAATSTCLADYIVQTCLGTENDKLSACDTTDYACQCAAYQAIVTCYNNCPDDPAKSTMAGQVTVFCGLASQYASSTTTMIGADKTASGSVGALQTAAPSTTGSSSETATGAASTASQTTNSNNGAELALNAGGLLAAVAGVVAAVL